MYTPVDTHICIYTHTPGVVHVRSSEHIGCGGLCTVDHVVRIHGHAVIGRHHIVPEPDDTTSIYQRMCVQAHLIVLYCTLLCTVDHVVRINGHAVVGRRNVSSRN
jgi:hypothetical protein